MNANNCHTEETSVVTDSFEEEKRINLEAEEGPMAAGMESASDKNDMEQKEFTA
eukprot:CAMPEP_0178843676 /NCGR_PEP_ID=MMETSP0746-20121128/16305_1 /TAXON_ID=913974 /ORGANISM="Nitzschia punctata, Strain CCMP561" /LENGTH=53 /DNA_ID=CAMNT_0020507369 /DNA_START=24 /DNA_END=181 /DNA_ORIENTATION=+